MEEGLVASLARPGGNVTGLSSMQMDLSGKRLEILREIVPSASRVAVLWIPHSAHRSSSAVQDAARVLGIELLELQVTGRPSDLDHAFEIAKRDQADALLVIATTLFFGLQGIGLLTSLLHHRLPAIYPLPSYAHSGGLVSYGQSDTEYYRRAAVYVDKILKGTKPEDLPVQQPTKFELVINLKTAKALGLEVPPIAAGACRRGDRMKRRKFLSLLGTRSDLAARRARAAAGEGAADRLPGPPRQPLGAR